MSFHFPLLCWISLIIFHVPTAFADTEVLVNVASDSITASLKTDPRVLEMTSVFTNSQQQWMTENGLKKEAKAIKIRFIDSSTQKAVQAEYPLLEWNTNAEIHLHATTIQDRFNDPLYNEQWNLQNSGQSVRVFLDDNRSKVIQGNPQYDLHFQNVFQKLKPPVKPIRIAVLDTGIDTEHPDLKNQIEKGWNAIFSNSNFTDNNGHGTHVAGIIAAETDNGGVSGVLGFSGYAKLLPIKVIDASPNSPIRPQSEGSTLSNLSKNPLPTAPSGKTLLDAVARGMIYALEANVDVINLSLAWPEFANTPMIERIFNAAIERGVLVVASAGNDGTDARVYPCNYTGVICVGSSDPDGNLSYFSNYGPSVDTVAPGSVILSTWPLNIRNSIFTDRAGFEFKSGTSMAAPLVSGVAALLKSQGLEPDDIRRRISMSAYQNPLRTEYDKKTGLRFGVLDIQAALQLKDSPFLQVQEKGAIKIIWNGETEIPLEINLINRGNLDLTTSVHFQVLDEESRPTEIGIQSNPALNQTFPIQKNVTLQTELSLPSHQLFPGKLWIKADFLNHPSLLIPVDLVRQFQPDQATLPETGPGSVFPPEASLRTVEPGLVLLQDTKPDAFHFQWVRVDDEKAERLTEWSLPVSANETRSLLTAQAVDINLDGTKDWVLLFQITTRESRRPTFEFRVITTAGQELRDFKLRYDNLLSILPESFEWMKTESQGMVPVWLGSGFTPPIEKPVLGPWDQPKNDAPQFRLYYLDRKLGLRTVLLPDDQFPVRLIRLESGTLRLLTSETGKAPAGHNTYLLSNGTVSEPALIAMEHYRGLLGLSDIDAGEKDELVFAGPGLPGELRLSRFNFEKNTIVGKAIRLKPNGVFDSVMQSLGIFKNKWAMALQLHSVTFFNLITGQKLSLTQNRFTYLPSLLFVRNFFQSVSKDRYGQLQPAVFIPSPLSVEDAFEVITLSESGSAIIRPAQYRWENSKNCVRLGNPVISEKTNAGSVFFRCSNGRWGQVQWVE